jgi:hypothetical protein
MVHLERYEQGHKDGVMKFHPIDADPVAQLIVAGKVRPHKAVLERFGSFENYCAHIKKLMSVQNAETTRSGASKLPCPPTAAQTAAAKKSDRLAHLRRVQAATAGRQLANLRLECDQLRRENQELRNELLLAQQELRAQAQAREQGPQAWNFSFASSLPSKDCRRLTGLDSEYFKLLVGMMTKALSKHWTAETSFQDALTIFFIKLRLDLPYDVLAMPTGIPATTLSRHFRELLARVSHVFREILCRKTRESIMRRAGTCFSLPNGPGPRMGLLIDAFEVR